MRTKRIPTYAVVLLAVCFFAGGIYALNDISLYTPDSTRYLVWAKSLASFGGYCDATMPEAARYVVHAPLYALLLTPIAWIYPFSLAAAKIVTLCTGVLLLFLAYSWYARSSGRPAAMLGCLVLAANPLVFLYSIEVLSDVPFAASLICGWLATDALCREARFRPATLALLTAAVAAGLLFREIGISILLSTVAYLIIRRKYREAAVVFIVPALIYAGWYVRNELIVAPVENPPLTNARILTYHFLTPSDGSLLQEFAARIANNASVYATQIGDLICTPLYFSRQYDVIAPTDPGMSSMTAALGFLRYPFMLLACGSAIYGLWNDLRRSKSALLRIFFLVSYCGVMLTYPINDIRFLLPLLLLMVYYCLVCWSPVLNKPSGTSRYALAACVVLSLLPNLLWETLFARNSAAYDRSSAAYAESHRSDPSAPTHFSKQFRPAGDWLMAHTDTGAVIMSQWKDVAIWVGDRKVMNVDQTIAPDEFEYLLRDYHVSILVSQRKRSGSTEFELPMHQSRRFAFRLMVRFGETEIYRIDAAAAGSVLADDTPFKRSLTLLAEGRYSVADSVLTVLWRANRQNVAALFMLATVKGCTLNFREADSLFSLLRTYPQAGMYLGRAASQQQLLRELGALPGMSRVQRADVLCGAATGYWSMGLRFRARELIGDAFREDSVAAPAMVFGFHFALRENDLPAAREMADRLARVTPSHPLAPALGAIIALRDSIDHSSGAQERSMLAGRLARQFYAIGLHEDAIDYLLRARAEGSEDPDLTILLADIYVGKHRFAPARKLLASFLLRHPDSAVAKARLDELPSAL